MLFHETTLVPGTKYKIEFYGMDVYTGTYLHDIERKRYFEKVTCLYSETLNPNLIQHLTIPSGYRYYIPIFQRDRIQSDMERRAVNLILQRIIGDTSFTW
jgi:hypothetical protein